MSDKKNPAKRTKRVRLGAPQAQVNVTRTIPAEELRDPSGQFTEEPGKDKDGKSEVVTHKVKAKIDVYYLVNPGGAVHELTRQDARVRLGQGRGWRRSTAAEIAQYKAAAVQTFDNPIAPRWQAGPDVLPELE